MHLVHDQITHYTFSLSTLNTGVFFNFPELETMYSLLGAEHQATVRQRFTIGQERISEEGETPEAEKTMPVHQMDIECGVEEDRELMELADNETTALLTQPSPDGSHEGMYI